MRKVIFGIIIAFAVLAVAVSAEVTVDFTYDQGENSDWQNVAFTGIVSGLSDNVTVLTWSWDYRDGSTGSGQTASHQFLIEGDDDLVQTVGLTVAFSDNTTASHEENIDLDYPSLDAEFTILPASKTGYAPLEIEVSDTTLGPHEREWTWDDSSSPSSLSQTSHTYDTADSYTVRLTVTRGTESDYIEKIVTVNNPAVTAAFSANKTTGIVPVAVNFSDQSSGSVASWAWEIEGLTTSSSQNFAYTFNTAGNYSVKLTVTGTGGETDSEEKLGYILVTPNITAGFTATPTTGDNPLTVKFTDTSTGYNLFTSRNWDFGDNSTPSTNANPEHTYLYAGNYTVSMTVGNIQGYVTVTKENYIVVTHDSTATPTPTPAATTATPTPTHTATTAPTEAALANTADLTVAALPGTKIFGIPGTEFFRTEVGRLYSFYKEYLFMITHL